MTSEEQKIVETFITFLTDCIQRAPRLAKIIMDCQAESLSAEAAFGRVASHALEAEVLVTKILAAFEKCAIHGRCPEGSMQQCDRGNQCVMHWMEVVHGKPQEQEKT